MALREVTVIAEKIKDLENNSSKYKSRTFIHSEVKQLISFAWHLALAGYSISYRSDQGRKFLSIEDAIKYLGRNPKDYNINLAYP